jgi:tRNA(fMet)-specific endonuclease VapC
VSYLLDTDTCSACVKGHPAVVHKFLQYGGRLHVSTITVAELYAWVLRPGAAGQREQDLEELLQDVVQLPVDQPVARKFGEVRALQKSQGLATPVMDLLIAATALVHGLTLVTHNVSDYANVPGLPIDDWLAP